MDPRAFCTSTRVLIVAGKGGVGKTTVSAALARTASLAGLRTLLVEVEGRSLLAGLYGKAGDLDYHERVLLEASPTGGAEVRARTLTPDDALIEYLNDHGLKRISKRLSRTGMIDVVATAAPGIKDILVLGKVKQLERGGRFGDKLDPEETGGPVDLIVVDAPAAGHAVQFLQSASGLLDAVSVGPIRAQAQEVVELLRDPTRARVVLVTLPEETPVNELVQTAYALEDRVGVQLAPVIVNGLYPRLEGLDVDPEDAARDVGVTLEAGEADALRQAAAFRRSRQELQAEQVARLAEALPLPQLQLPYLFADRIGRPEMETLAAALTAQIQGLEVANT
ncbi:MAG: ArsA-related P-loop ATPase [Acidimicrobiales bacterium]